MSKLTGFVFAALAALPMSTQAATLLSVDLSVVNEVTITAEAGLADTSENGFTFTGIYLPNFFSTPVAFDQGGSVGNFTTANQTANGNARIYSAGGDSGLNIYNFNNSFFSSVTAGTQAFSGSSTWTLTPGLYAEFVNAPGTSTIYFPADTADDVAGSTAIGEFVTSNVAPVPLPAPVLLLGAALFGLIAMGRRRTSRRDGLVPA